MYWGTYSAIKEAAQQAEKNSSRLPRFKRFDGGGLIRVQIQDHPKQIPDEVFKSTHRVLQIDPVDPRAWDPKVPRRVRKKLQRTKLRIRVGSIKSKPVWTEFLMVMHRPFPEGTRITHAMVTRRKHANWDRYSVQFSVEIPIPEPLTTPKRVVAFDWGWRMAAGGLRVAYWADTDGNHGEFRLPSSIRERFALERLKKSQRSTNLDNLKAGLREDLGDRKQLDPEIRQATQHMLCWRAQRRFVQLLKMHGDKMPQTAQKRLTAWFHLDRHNWQYEAGVRSGVIGHRNDIYKNWAAELAAQYDAVVIEDLKLANLSSKAKPEKKKDIPNGVAAMRNKSSAQRVEAAPSLLRDYIEKAMKKQGKFAETVPPHNTSRICASCGHKCNLGPEQMHTCEGCGVTFDRDHNAARNLLKKGLDQIAKGLSWPKPKPHRFAHRHKKAA
jgi:transposase